MFGNGGKKSGVTIFNEKIALGNGNRDGFHSIWMLYASKVLVVMGLFLIVLDNLGLVTNGRYFGSLDWPTAVVLSIGIVLSFVSIPYLYMSSFGRFKRDDEFWDEELFWILPTFFFGTFFLYGSGYYSSNFLFYASLLVILMIHFKFFLTSLKLAKESESLVGKHQYFQSLQYLTLYYVLLIGLFVYLNPVQMLRSWISYYFVEIG